jgi:hypothetical protein
MPGPGSQLSRGPISAMHVVKWPFTSTQCLCWPPHCTPKPGQGPRGHRASTLSARLGRAADACPSRRILLRPTDDGRERVTFNLHAHSEPGEQIKVAHGPCVPLQCARDAWGRTVPQFRCARRKYTWGERGKVHEKRTRRIAEVLTEDASNNSGTMRKES